MSILSYFDRAGLPDPKGPLSKEVPVISITEANKEVLKAINNEKSISKKRGSYNKVTPELKAKIARHAVENGNSSAARKFSKTLDKDLNESTVRSWVTQYKKELSRKRQLGETVPAVQVLPPAKRGRPLLIGDQLDSQVKAYIRCIRESGGVITSAIAVAAGTAIVRKHDPKLLAECGGHIILTKHWAKSLLYRMQFVKRRSCSTKKIMVQNFEELKDLFLKDIRVIVKMEDIPQEMILNWDHTAVSIVPGSSWTIEMRGKKRVEITGLDDKRQITAVVCGTLSGETLPLQLIYQGKTSACLPKVIFPADWHITCTPNHWSNEEKTSEYLKFIRLPYIQAKRKELGLPDTFPALAIFDVFKGQTTDAIYKLLEENNIYIVSIPANCTDRLQPMDLSVNKSIKDFMKTQFNNWYSSQVFEQLEDKEQKPVDLRLSVMKPLGAKWLIKLFNYLKANNGIIINGFKAAGIADIVKD